MGAEPPAVARVARPTLGVASRSTWAVRPGAPKSLHLVRVVAAAAADSILGAWGRPVAVHRRPGLILAGKVARRTLDRVVAGGSTLAAWGVEGGWEVLVRAIISRDSISAGLDSLVAPGGGHLADLQVRVDRTRTINPQTCLEPAVRRHRARALFLVSPIVFDCYTL